MFSVAQRLARFLNSTLVIAWGLYLFFLPVTSLPALSKIGNTLVAPASLIPLVWLSAWLVLYLTRGGKIPNESIPLLFFSSTATISSAMAFALDIPPFKNKAIPGEEATALATLAIGILFYLVTASWIFQQPTQLINTLRWISLGGALALSWAIVQAVYIFFFDSHFPTTLLLFHRFFSIRDFSLRRITAFSYEPSWLAHQLNMLYLPLWLSATLRGWSAFPFRLGRLSIENILLGMGGAVVLLSSRIGALSFLSVACIVVVHYSAVLVRRMCSRLTTYITVRSRRLRNFLSRLAAVALATILLSLYFILTLGVIYGLAHIDPRMKRIIDLPSWLCQQSSLNTYLVFRYLAFAERYIYWIVGWRVFSLYPILGVGLGNAGFFFPSLLPLYGKNLTEVTEYLYLSSYLPNIKSFWIRLLAETGIVGFASFLAWYIVMWTSARFLRHETNPLYRTIGWAGLFVLVAFITEGFSVDTFALPYLWVSLGIVSATAAVARQEH